MTKFYFWRLPVYANSLFPKAVSGKSSYPHDCYFTVKSLINMEYFFISNCKLFHRFSDKYSLNNNILNFTRNSVCRILLSRTSSTLLVRRYLVSTPSMKGGGGVEPTSYDFENGSSTIFNFERLLGLSMRSKKLVELMI